MASHVFLQFVPVGTTLGIYHIRAAKTQKFRRAAATYQGVLGARAWGCEGIAKCVKYQRRVATKENARVHARINANKRSP